MSGFPIRINGVPVPQGSHAVSRQGRTYESNPKLRPWRATMTAALTAWQATWQGAFVQYDGPLLVDVTFWMPRPKKPMFHHPATPPDEDKLQRALGDSLTDSGTIRDDARITTWHARKRFSDTPGITIHNITEDEA